MYELDGIGQVDGLFGIAGLKEDLMDVAVLGASAGVSVVVGEYLFSKVDTFAKMGIYTQAGVAVALGVAGGLAAGRYVNKGVGAGIAAGLVGWGIARSVQYAMLPKEAKAAIDAAKAPAAATTAATAGIGQYNSDLLLGLHATPGVVDNDIAISDYRPLPGQTNGLAQAGDVYTSDLQPMPGTSGTSGYMQGIGSFIS